jgi:XTP/dITP diphosphohydrolase
MRRSLRNETRLVLASHNPGKLREIAALLHPYGMEAVSAGELGLEEPEESGATFADNARLKACAAARASGRVALSDDSGLCVQALDGQPGVYSARWAGEGKDFSAAIRRVESELLGRGGDDRRAYFVCALCLCWPDGHTETFQGEIHGRLVFPPRGALGFGYDPIFIPEGYEKTFGEMDPDVKHAISHRAIAFRQMTDACFTG